MWRWEGRLEAPQAHGLPQGAPPPTLILASGLWNLETVLGAGALSEGSDAAAPGD